MRNRRVPGFGGARSGRAPTAHPPLSRGSETRGQHCLLVGRLLMLRDGTFIGAGGIKFVIDVRTSGSIRFQAI